MAEDHRVLAVIMLTDIVGSTTLAQQDESLLLELLTEHNHLLRESFTAYDGREIKCTGDGFLVLFESTLQSVECALDIQSRCEQRNASVDSDRAFFGRITFLFVRESKYSFPRETIFKSPPAIFSKATNGLRCQAA